MTNGTDPNRAAFFSGSAFDPALAKQGINNDDRTSEPDNNRCWITVLSGNFERRFASKPASWA